VDALAQVLSVDSADGGLVEARQAQARKWTWRQCAEQTFAAYRAALSG
jgi:hypothetical protein